MKISRLFILFALISLVPFANSCKVTYPNEKYMIGSWTPVKVEKYTEPVTPTAEGEIPKEAQRPVAKSDTNVQKGKSGTQSSVQTRTPEEELQRMITTEGRTTLVVYSEKKMVVKNYPGKIVKGTWKMKKKGTQVIAKEITTGKKMTMDILSINDTSAVVVERLPYGDIKITYKKDK
jgi:hypothetical protein